LFSRLGTDGIELLARLRFDEVSFEKIGDACRQRVPAYTRIGSHLISVCPAFSALRLPEAAVTVIHEALHSAGMSEKPYDPGGFTAAELNGLVKTNCGL
jgi:hypothetical protein